MSELDSPLPAKPLWRRVFDFPLVAMVVAGIALLGFSIGVGYGLQVVFAGLAPTMSAVITGTVVSLVTVLVMKFIVSRLGERRHDEFPVAGAVRLTGMGIASAFVLMSAIVGVIALLGGYRIEGWGGATSWPILLFIAGLQAAFLEEAVFRGIMFRFLEDFGGSWFALAFTAAIFGLLHLQNPNASAVGALGIAVSAGLLLGGAYMLTRSLWLPVGLHFGWNVTQGFVWDVPVSGIPVDGVVDAHPAGSALISGGMFGAEASVVAMVIAGVAGIWVIRRAVQVGKCVRPWWVRRRHARKEAINLNA